MQQEMTFGQRLRGARLGAGMSQSDLEDRSGIPKARLSRYENGHVAPSIQTLERLARALAVSQASLLGEEPGGLGEFSRVLNERGVRIDTPEQGARLANALADMLQTLGGADAPAQSPPALPKANDIAAAVMAFLGAAASGAAPKP
jgi:transcriptional regulator with XRE-family HTH domain